MRQSLLGVLVVVVSMSLASCSNQTYEFGDAIAVGVSDQAGLASLLVQADTVCTNLVSFGFKQTSFCDNASKRVATFSGRYKSYSGVRVNVSCLKVLDTKRPELRIKLSGGESRNPKAIQASSELSQLIQSWMK